MGLADPLAATSGNSTPLRALKWNYRRRWISSWVVRLPECMTFAHASAMEQRPDMEQRHGYKRDDTYWQGEGKAQGYAKSSCACRQESHGNKETGCANNAEQDSQLAVSNRVGAIHGLQDHGSRPWLARACDYDATDDCKGGVLPDTALSTGTMLLSKAAPPSHRDHQSPSNWSVVCDFDGTICQQDVMDTLLERFGGNHWEQLEADWLAGKLGSRDCMQGQVADLRMSQAQLDAHLGDMRLDPDFAHFVALTRQLQMPLAIASDGLDYAIHTLLQRDGLQDLPVAANCLHAGEALQQWWLSSPNQASGCGSGTCKCARMGQMRSSLRPQVLLIGDGSSDFCAAGNADFVFAKDKLATHCRHHDIAHARIENFADACHLLPALLNGQLQELRQGADSEAAI